MSTKMVNICNPMLEKQPDDHFHHLGITKSLTDIPQMYGDVKFICMGGSMTRLQNYAKTFAKEVGIKMSDNLSTTDRYVMYKTGQVLWVNHGIGAASLSIIIVELIKLLYYAKAEDVIAIRLGTSGGVGAEPGTIILSSEAVNGELLDKHISRPAIFDAEVYQQLYKVAVQLKIPVQIGKTLCTDDFYEGQARLDGAFCEYTEQQNNVQSRKYKTSGTMCNIVGSIKRRSSFADT
ncbi:Uridine and thymidine phosphorylase [Dirofilaria immitis]